MLDLRSCCDTGHGSVLRDLLEACSDASPESIPLDVSGTIARLFLLVIVAAEMPADYSWPIARISLELCRKFDVNNRSGCMDILAGCVRPEVMWDEVIAFDIFALASHYDDRATACKIICSFQDRPPDHPILPLEYWFPEQTREVSSLWVKDLMEVTIDLDSPNVEENWEEYLLNFARIFRSMDLLPGGSQPENDM